jgi:hypothetical protein
MLLYTRGVFRESSRGRVLSTCCARQAFHPHPLPSPLKGEGSPSFSTCSRAFFHKTFDNIHKPLKIRVILQIIFFSYSDRLSSLFLGAISWRVMKDFSPFLGFPDFFRNLFLPTSSKIFAGRFAPFQTNSVIIILFYKSLITESIK